MSTGWELKIYGAAYGLENVTGIVKNKVIDGGKLSFKASNDSLGGENWKGYKKTLVVVYQYKFGTYAESHILTKIVKEDECCKINPPGVIFNDPPKEHDVYHLQEIEKATVGQSPTTSQPLVILGAAYGTKNVTKLAKERLSKDGKYIFDEKASNDNWGGDPWKHHDKTLVVVYEYDGLKMVDVVKESESMYFIASPPMYILSAAYGLGDVTDEVIDCIKNDSLTITPNNDLFGDRWSGVEKSFTVVYQYGQETPQIKVAKENKEVKIFYRKTDLYLQSTDPRDLTILGASYGPCIVTEKIQKDLVKGNALDIKVENKQFSKEDPCCQAKKKSLVVVYSKGCSPPKMKIIEEGHELKIDAIHSPYDGGLTCADTLLEDGDVLALKTIDGKYICCGSDNKLFPQNTDLDEKCMFTIKKDSKGRFFKILLDDVRPEDNNAKNIVTKDDGSALKLKTKSNGEENADDKKRYVVVNKDENSALYATGSEEEATEFSASLSANGNLRLATKDKRYVGVNSIDNAFTASFTNHFVAVTSFLIDLKSPISYDIIEPSSCETSWAIFIWQIIGGAFIDIGLATYIDTGTARPGILGIVRSNERAWSKIKEFVEAIKNGAMAKAKLMEILLSIINILYHAGLLWKVFKLMLRFATWYAITEALAKVISVVFRMQPEGAKVMAGAVKYAIQTADALFTLNNECYDHQ